MHEYMNINTSIRKSYQLSEIEVANLDHKFGISTLLPIGLKTLQDFRHDLHQEEEKNLCFWKELQQICVAMTNIYWYIDIANVCLL